MCVYVCVFIYLKTKVGNNGLNGTEQSSECKNPKESQCYVARTFHTFNFFNLLYSSEIFKNSNFFSFCLTRVYIPKPSLTYI